VRFLILAVDHEWQLVPFDLESPDISAAKCQLAKLVSEALTDQRIELVCEESDPCRLSIAQKIAYERNPPIPWKNINMSAQERFEAGILEALLHRPRRETEELGAPGYIHSIDLRIPEDKTREQFFVTESVRGAEGVGATNILILCGDMHADAVKGMLEERGFDVDANHELIKQKAWE
jgi:hypothetical protein